MTTFFVREPELQGFDTNHSYDSRVQAYFALQRSLIASGKLVEVGLVDEIDDDVEQAFTEAKKSSTDDFIDF